MKFLIAFLLALSLHAERIDLITHFTDEPYVSYAKVRDAGLEVRVTGLYDYANGVSFFEPKRIFVFGHYSLPREFAMIPKNKLVLFLWEPTPVPNWYLDLFSRVYTWNDALVDGVKFFKFNYPYRKPMIQELVPFEEKQLCVMINSNLTFERKKMLEFFEGKPNGELDLFGEENGISASYKSYRGPVAGPNIGGQKGDVLKKYRFCLCFENCHHLNGYVTEKIFGCFAAGCVPIYWGAVNILDHIPKNCFVDYRDFQTKEDLYMFIKNMPKAVYDEYIEHIRDYLKSARSYPFSKEHLEDIFLDAAVNN